MGNSSAEHDRMQPGRLEYFPLLFSAPEYRSNIASLLNINDAWLSTVVHMDEPSVAQIKLAWWQQELDRIKNDEAVHPLTPKDPPFSKDTVTLLQGLLGGYQNAIEHDIKLLSTAERSDYFGPAVQWAICLEQKAQDDTQLKQCAHALGVAWTLYQKTLGRARLSTEELDVLTQEGLSHLEKSFTTQPEHKQFRFSVLLTEILKRWFGRASQIQPGKQPINLMYQLWISWTTALKLR